MSFISVNKVCLAYGDREILKNVSFTLGEKSRTALSGGNGEGKTTLMKIMSGIIPMDSGEISKSKNMKISYLPQSDIVLRDNSAYNEIEKGFSYYTENLNKQHEIETFLKLNPDAPETYILQLHELQEEINQSEYYNRETIIGTVAKGLGIKEDDLNRKCCEFSGGFQMRISLARILVEKPDLMLLDEPTNYLDIEAEQFLQNYLDSYKGSVLLVCHDRDFLDKTVNQVLELNQGNITLYKGNYSFYEKKRIEEIKQLNAEYSQQQKQIEKTEKFIERFRYKNRKAKQVQSRIKQLDKMDIISLPPHLKTLRFSFPEPPHSPNDVITISNLCKSYSDNIIYENFSLYVRKGQKLAVTGRNGIGKTTLLKIIAGSDHDYTGEVKTGSGIIKGYYSQDTADSLNLDLNVLEQVLPYGDENRIRTALGAFLFTGDDIYKKTSVLSGGERARLSLLKILLNPASLLILDEPTNHLDINSKDMLLNALKAYTGTIIFVSHDKYFIKNIADSILYLTGKEKILINGDYEFFEYKLNQMVNITSSPEKTDNSKSNTPQIDVKESAKNREISNRERNYIQRLKKEAEKKLSDVSELDETIKTLNEQINTPEIYSVAEKINPLIEELKIKEKEKKQTEERWMEIMDELGKLESDV